MANKITKFPGPKRMMPKKVGVKQNALNPQVPNDPQFTMEVKNDAVEELLKIQKENPSADNLNQLVNAMVPARVLVPVRLNENKQPQPLVLQAGNGDKMFPIYTSKAQIPTGEKAPKSDGILNMPYAVVNDFAGKSSSEVAGIAVNPFTHNLIFKKALIDRINEVQKNKKEAKENGTAAPQVKQVKMTEKDYYLFERKNYEFGFLPKKFFENTAEFVETLCDRREEYLDELYEEMYQNKRMYPYLPEDFAVMPMGISETLTAVRIDMPERDMGVPSCFRVYLVYDKESELARYYTIEKAAEGKLLGEMNAQLKHETLGEAPIEGVELQAILEKAGVAEE